LAVTWPAAFQEDDGMSPYSIKTIGVRNYLKIMPDVVLKALKRLLSVCIRFFILVIVYITVLLILRLV
jgi:hypothetical protein